MPKVTVKGKTKEFSYSPAGMKAAKSAAKMPGAKMMMPKMAKSKMMKKMK